MGRPKKTKEQMDWFTAKIIRGLCKGFEKTKEEHGEQAAKIFREMLFHDEFIHHCSKGSYRQWIMAYQWLIKLEWNPKHQVPEKSSVRKALKSQGLLMQKYFRMAERCLTFANVLELYHDYDSLPSRLPYKTAIDWIDAVVNELLHTAWMDASTSKYKDFDIYGNVINGNIKNGLVAIERERLTLIKKAYDSLLDQDKDSLSMEVDQLPYQEFPHMIAYRDLLCYSMFLAIRSEQFCNDYWKPFLKQYSAWIREMSSPAWQTVMLKSDNNGDLTEWQSGYDNSQVCIGDLTPLKKLNFIPHTQQGFQDLAQSFSRRANPDYNPRKISLIAPKYF